MTDCELGLDEGQRIGKVVWVGSSRETNPFERMQDDEAGGMGEMGRRETRRRETWVRGFVTENSKHGRSSAVKRVRKSA